LFGKACAQLGVDTQIENITKSERSKFDNMFSSFSFIITIIEAINLHLNNLYIISAYAARVLEKI